MTTNEVLQQKLMKAIKEISLTSLNMYKFGTETELYRNDAILSLESAISELREVRSTLYRIGKGSE